MHLQEAHIATKQDWVSPAVIREQPLCYAVSCGVNSCFTRCWVDTGVLRCNRLSTELPSDPDRTQLQHSCLSWLRSLKTVLMIPLQKCPRSSHGPRRVYFWWKLCQTVQSRFESTGSQTQEVHRETGQFSKHLLQMWSDTIAVLSKKSRQFELTICNIFTLKQRKTSFFILYFVELCSYIPQIFPTMFKSKGGLR